VASEAEAATRKMAARLIVWDRVPGFAIIETTFGSVRCNGRMRRMLGG
jgi:hypothetical protein